MVFQRRPHVVETVECGLVQATGLAGHAQHFLAEVDGTRVRLVAVLFPICIDDLFDHVGVEQRGQRGQALDRHAEPNGHARHRDEFGQAGTDRARAARRNALAVERAVGLGEAREIVVKVPAQALGEGVPGGLSLLDRRLSELPQRAAIDGSLQSRSTPAP